MRYSTVTNVTDESFKEEVLDFDQLFDKKGKAKKLPKELKPVLVDFWASWCGPSRMVAPVVDEIAEQYEGQVKVVKLNTDENPTTASNYGIRSIPTLMIFKGGQRVDMVVGATPRETLIKVLEPYIPVPEESDTPRKSLLARLFHL